MDDSMIVDLYLSRDESAISHTASKYGAKLRVIANRMLDDPFAAEECENDTYLAAWRRIPPNEPRTYLFAFLSNRTHGIAVDKIRKQSSGKRSAILCELTKEMAECLPSDSIGAEDAALAKELGGVITAFLKKRPRDQQIVFVRRYWYYDTIEEISLRFGFSKSKVNMILSRMRKDLISCLRKEGYYE